MKILQILSFETVSNFLQYKDNKFTCKMSIADRSDSAVKIIPFDVPSELLSKTTDP